jgi:hypothetical protein
MDLLALGSALPKVCPRERKGGVMNEPQALYLLLVWMIVQTVRQ